MRLARALVLLLLAPALPAAAQAPRRTYLHEARDVLPDGPQLLRELDQALAGDDAPRAARALDRLLELTLDGGAASALVEAGPGRWAGVRAAALERLAALPAPAREALRALQDQGAAGLRVRDRRAPVELLVRRFPCAGDARDAGYELLGRALEANEPGRARALRERLLRAHPEAAEDPRLLLHQAAIALVAGDAAALGTALLPLRALPALREPVERLEQARQALRARPVAAPALQPPPPPGARLAQRAAAPLTEPVGGVGAYSAALPLVVGERVVVSNGAQLLVLDLAGKVVAQLPALAESAAAPPPEQTRFLARPWARGGLCAVPLLLERWLAPARGTTRGRDASFAGSYYSLVLTDAPSGRLLWWDGDAGPAGVLGEGRSGPPGSGDAPPAQERPPTGPPGSGDAPAPLQERLRRGHVLAVTGDAERVYAALLFQGDDLELGVFAWRLDAASQPVELRPAWSSVTHLFAAERAGDLGGDEAAVHAEVAAALALDDAGRLVVTTDVGVAACVDAVDGDLLWLHEAPPQRPSRPPGGRPRLELALGPTAIAPPEPARPLGKGLVAFVQGSQLVAATLERGEPAWSLPVGEAPRTLLLSGDRLVAYAADRLLLVHATSGQASFSLQLPGERCAGEGVVWGDGLLLPVVDGAASRVRRVELRGGGRAGAGGFLILGSEWAAPNHRGPFNLAASGQLLVAASGRLVNLLAWEPRPR